MNLRRALSTLFATASLLLAFACGGGGGGSSPAPSVTVSVSPATVTLTTNGTQTFTATVGNTTNTAVTWSVVEGGGGSITSGGAYTAPATPGTYHVKATSQADATKFGTATVTVNPPPATTLSYTDPTSGTYQVQRNAGLSTGTHLVLDVVGSGAPNGAGLAFTLTADATRLTFTKVNGADAQYIQNGAVLNLGSAPLGIRGKVSGNTLTAGLGQKGTGSSVALNGVLARFAVDLAAGAPQGTASLGQTKAKVLQSDGTLADITLTFGTVTAN